MQSRGTFHAVTFKRQQAALPLFSLPKLFFCRRRLLSPLPRVFQQQHAVQHRRPPVSLVPRSCDLQCIATVEARYILDNACLLPDAINACRKQRTRVQTARQSDGTAGLGICLKFAQHRLRTRLPHHFTTGIFSSTSPKLIIFILQGSRYNTRSPYHDTGTCNLGAFLRRWRSTPCCCQVHP